MKKLTSFGLLLCLSVSLVGCDSAKKAVDDAKSKAGDIAGVDFGDFDMKGLTEKLSGITDGFKSVSADNVDGLTSKISGLTGALDGMKIGNLTGGAKTAVTTLISGFVKTVTTAMGGITDEGILGKLKPVIEPLMEKLKGFM